MKLPPSIDYFLASKLPSVGGRAPVAVFDCDGTLIKGDIGEAMFYYQVEHFLFRESPAQLWPDHPDKEELEHLFRSLVQFPPYVPNQDGRHISFANLMLSWYFGQLEKGKTAKACSDIVRLCSGFKPAELTEIAADTLAEQKSAPPGERLVGKHLVPQGVRYIKETIELLRRVTAAGFEVWVVSGSNSWGVYEICRPLEISGERIIGIELGVKGDLFSEDVIKPVPVREGKVDALKSRGLPEPAVVVSDSIYDLPLFEYCSGLKVFIDSNEGAEAFFRKAGTLPDERWAVIAQPTLLP